MYNLGNVVIGNVLVLVATPIYECDHKGRFSPGVPAVKWFIYCQAK